MNNVYETITQCLDGGTDLTLHELPILIRNKYKLL